MTRGKERWGRRGTGQEGGWAREVGCQHCWAKEREKGEGTGLRRETKKKATKEREPRLARFELLL
jgi:hypothetical protein